MRIPYPERIPYTGAFIFASGLLSVQLLEHTGIVFSVLSFCFLMVFTAAFNVAGGLYRPAGAYIFFNAVLTLIIGLITKAFLGEAADTNVAIPVKALTVYVFGMVSMLTAAFIESRYRPSRGFLSKALPLRTLRGVYLGAAIIGVPSSLFWLSGPKLTAGSFLLAFRNTDELVPFAMLVGVIYTVRASNGRRSMTPLLAFLYLFCESRVLIDFSKQTLFTPILCWVLAVGLSRYKLKPLNFVLLPVIVFVLYYFGTPYVAVGKGTYRPDLSSAITVAVDQIEHFGKVRDAYNEELANGYVKIDYYNHGEGLLERLQMFTIDAQLIQLADQYGYFGFEPAKEGWENIVPHIIWKNKPTPFFGNMYAHRLDLLADEDSSTGVSFGVTADSYFEGGLYGVLVIQTLCFIAIFTVFSFVIGDVREHPANILLVLFTSHVAPEGMLPGAISLVLACVTVIGFALFCRYIFALVTDTFLPESSLPNPAAQPAFAAAD
jgi:hypothetical protein